MDTLDVRVMTYASEPVGPIVALYADGGICLKNPSVYGGSFAFVHVDAAGVNVAAGYGHVRHPYGGLTYVSNNLTEFVAVLVGLEKLPDGWDGCVYSDSLNTIRSFRDHPMSKVPGHIPNTLWNRRNRALIRAGNLDWVLLGGHPTAKELAVGRRGDGKPVSRHNVLCDELCTLEAAYLVDTINRERAAACHASTRP